MPTVTKTREPRGADYWLSLGCREISDAEAMALPHYPPTTSDRHRVFPIAVYGGYSYWLNNWMDMEDFTRSLPGARWFAANVRNVNFGHGSSVSVTPNP